MQNDLLNTLGRCLNQLAYKLDQSEERILLANGALLAKQQCLSTSNNLNDYEFKIFSQFGDDGIIQYLIKNLAITNETFIEFGVQDYLESNTRFLLMNNNWRGFVMDGSAEAMARLQQQEWFWRYDLTCQAVFIDRDNINSLLAATGFTDIGLLHIDLDGNDYWIWEALDLSCLHPAIIIVEYNSIFGKERSLAVPYDPQFYRTEKHYSNLYWGASVKALEYLGERKGYALVGCNSAGNNTYFVRRDLLNARVPSRRAEDAYFEAKYRESRDRNGNLSYLRGAERQQVISEMEVVNVVTGQRETVGGITGGAAKIFNLGTIDNLLKAQTTSPALTHIKQLNEKRPLDINVETINFCPLQCVFCPNRQIKRERKSMSNEIFAQICADYYALGGGAIGINSMQADIFSDELLTSRLITLNKYRDKFYVYTTTNLVGAAKLSDDELGNFLNTFAFLVISIGGVEATEYRRMCGVDAWAVVWQQLQRCRRIIDQRQIKIRIDLALRTHQAAKIINSPEFAQLNTLFPITDVKDKFFTWYGRIKSADLPRGAQLIVRDNRGITQDCVVPAATLSFNPDGQAIGCGCIDWEAQHRIGDITQNSIQEIWQSDAARQFRQAFSQGKIPAICRDCGLYVSKDECWSRPQLAHYQVTDGLYYNC